MPVSFQPANHKSESFNGYRDPEDDGTPSSIFKQSCYAQYLKSDEILSTSFPSNASDVFATSNGFVDTINRAYSAHHQLIIRPDDVWLAILTQFNFFVNANAESLRSYFVSHEGQKKLTISTIDDIREAKFGQLAEEMTRKVEENILDPSLRSWALPDFSTTTPTDTIVSSVILMSTLKEYFEYEVMFGCGVPRVTLEGEKSDWEKILSRLEKLKEFGLQTIAWYHLLHPIISRFVAAFDNPDSPENLDFWGKVCLSEVGASDMTHMSGWITAFCVWNQDGKWMGNKFKIVSSPGPF